jgi:hypothetical protein
MLMSNKFSLALGLLAVSMAFGWAAACSSDNAASSPDSGASGSSSGGGGGGSDGGGSSSGALRDSGVSDAAGEAAGLGLLVDNMMATKGTQIALQVPASQVPGTFYVYSDVPVENASFMMSFIPASGQLLDAPVSPVVKNADGSQIAGEICFGGQVVSYAGLGMNLAQEPQDAPNDPNCPDGPPPVPFDASHYSGVSFYILVDASDGPTPSIHFGIPDSQTGDKCVHPKPACNLADAGGCYDDFASDVTFKPGMWTKVTYKWSDLSQGGWGQSFLSLKTNQLIGMKWQANGPGVDASASASFNFCISDIYFTP